jgi:hypothetical protein
MNHNISLQSSLTDFKAMHPLLIAAVVKNFEGMNLHRNLSLWIVPFLVAATVQCTLLTRRFRRGPRR